MLLIEMNADKVRALREEMCWSRRDFAVTAGLSETTARRAERWQPVRVKTASKIGAAFGSNPRTIAQTVSQAREA